MKNRLLGVLIPGVLIVGGICSATAQVSGYSFQRRQIFSQLESNIVPVFYGARATAISVVGNLTGGEIRGPVSTNALSGNGALLSFATNWPALDTNQTSGLSQLNAAYPLGSYQLRVGYELLSVPLTSTQDFDLTNDFPTVTPQVTNIPPFSVLSVTQRFEWPAFAGGAEDHASFYLIEGLIDTNQVLDLIEAYKEDGTQALTNAVLNATNNLTFLATERNLSAGLNSIVVEGIDPTAGHVALLQFHSVSATTNTVIPAEVASVSGSFIIYPRLQAPTLAVQPTNKIVLAGGTAHFGVVPVGWPLFYQWYQDGNAIPGATNALLSITNAQLTHAGAYHVTVTNSLGSVSSTPVLLTVFEPGQVTLTQASVANSNFQMTVESPVGTTNVVQMSTNLISWTNIAVITNAGVFIDTNVLVEPMRFYRYYLAE